MQILSFSLVKRNSPLGSKRAPTHVQKELKAKKKEGVPTRHKLSLKPKEEAHLPDKNHTMSIKAFNMKILLSKNNQTGYATASQHNSRRPMTT